MMSLSCVPQDPADVTVRPDEACLKARLHELRSRWCVRMCRDSPDLSELRGRIIQVFFKHLTSSNEVAVDMSQEGLAAVIAFQKMPKTLLQVWSTIHMFPLHDVLRSPCRCSCVLSTVILDVSAAH